MRGEIGAAREIARRGRQGRRDAGRPGQHDDDLALAVRDEIGVVEMAFAFRARGACRGSKGGSAGHRRRGPRDRRAGSCRRADRAATPMTSRMPAALAACHGPHDAGDAVAVGDRDRGVAERRRGHHQLVGMRGAAQEREIAGDLQLGIAGAGAKTRHLRRRSRRSRTLPVGPALPLPIVRDSLLKALGGQVGQAGFRRAFQANRPWTYQRGGGSPGSPARNSQKRRPCFVLDPVVIADRVGRQGAAFAATIPRRCARGRRRADPVRAAAAR